MKLSTIETKGTAVITGASAGIRAIYAHRLAARPAATTWGDPNQAVHEMTSRIMPFESMDAKSVLAETSKIYCRGKAQSALIFTGH
jgi:NAD(P)-dependent dehydrogenase (short-subunit alcohol dehydrogenase family)